jgi:altronate dehydratase
LQHQIPGTQEISDVFTKGVEEGSRVFVLQNHGVTVAGKDMNEAYVKLEILEFLAQVSFISKLYSNVNEIPKEKIAAFKEFFRRNKEEEVMMTNNYGNALQVNEKDNVATVFKDVKAGELIKVYKSDGSYEIVKAVNDIPYGHKISLKQISKNEKIVKYGEIIGIASVDIQKGEHVHIHNIDSMRGRGDLKDGKEGVI